MTLGQLIDWRKGVDRFLSNLNSKASANTVLQTILQNHNYVDSIKYFPNLSFRHNVQTKNPYQSTHVMIDILNKFIHDFNVCKTETWDPEIEHVKKLLKFRITQQFSIIKDDIVKACETCTDTYSTKSSVEICTSFQQLKIKLHSLWSSAKFQVLKFSATKKERSSH